MDHADVGIPRESPGAAGYRRRRENGFSGWTASGFDADPRTEVGKLTVAGKQMVEIAKALSRDARSASGSSP